jgi:hypothetical protein
MMLLKRNYCTALSFWYGVKPEEKKTKIVQADDEGFGIW